MNFDQKELFSLRPEELDAYLAKGWFRMHQSVFTTDIIWFNDVMYEAIWLRINLDTFSGDNRYKTLKKLNKDFTIIITDAEISNENEALFSLYRNHISFDAPVSLHWLLFGHRLHNVFNTKMVSVYHQSLLIGAGFFDTGKTTAAGIISFYHPEYKKYSLGKYIIYEKINYCKQQNLQYFYPGYVVPGYPAFDYKLSIAKNYIEYFDSVNNVWIELNK